MSNLLKDLRYSLRMLMRSPAVAVISILAFGLGMGTTTIMYTLVHGALRNLPFDPDGQIIALGRTNPSEGIERTSVTYHDFLDWCAEQTSYEDLAGFYQGTVNIAGTDTAERFDGGFMSANAFELLGVEPILGRSFTPAEDSPAEPYVIILGYEVWQNRYGGDPDVIGLTERVNSQPAEIIGVMPEGFEFPIAEQVWVPLRYDLARMQRGEGTELNVVGRLREGVTLDQARSEFDSITARLEDAYPETNAGFGAYMRPYTVNVMGQEAIDVMQVMLGSVFFVLLIACANVANLLLSRALDRSKEVAIRIALGASKLRVVSQILAETLVMAFFGGILGIWFAYIGVDLFNDATAGLDWPYWIDIRFDLPVLLFVAGTTLLTAVLAGGLPALQASRGNVQPVLQDESRGSSGFRLGRMSKLLVVAEVALSCGLLVAAGLMVKSVSNLANLEFPFPTDGVFTARVGLFDNDYPDDESLMQFYRELHRRLEEAPEIERATLTTSLPGSDLAERWRFALEGEAYGTPEEYPVVARATIGPGFFETFNTPLLDGRDFDTADDAEGMPVAIANASFVEKFFPGESPIGQRIQLGSGQELRDGRSEMPWMTIVGVVPDLFIEEIDSQTRNAAGIYTPIAQGPARFMSIAAIPRGGSGNALALTATVRQVVSTLDPDLPIYWARTLDEVIREETWFYSVFGAMFGIFGGVALFLATVGLYGVISFSVRRRTAEVGIRMALGADTRRILGLIFRQGSVQLAVGLAIGLMIAGLLANALQVIFFEVDPFDLTVWSGIVLMLLLTGLLACFIPAHRASRVDPITALRTQ
jgi:predicted permease